MLPKHRDAFSLSIIFTSSLQEVYWCVLCYRMKEGTRCNLCVSHACDMQNTQKSIMNKCFCCCLSRSCLADCSVLSQKSALLLSLHPLSVGYRNSNRETGKERKGETAAATFRFGYGRICQSIFCISSSHFPSPVETERQREKRKVSLMTWARKRYGRTTGRKEKGLDFSGGELFSSFMSMFHVSYCGDRSPDVEEDFN